MNKSIIGDCRKVLVELAQQGVKAQTCITSPPYYGLRDYGHSDQIGLEETVFDYVDNLVKVFTLLWDVLEDDGTLWLNLGDSYAGSGKGANPDGTPHKSTLQGKQGTNKGTVTGINKPNKASDHGLKPKDLIGVPWRVAFALQEAGWYLRSDIIWAKPNPMPESVKDRPTGAHEYIFLLTKQPKYYYDHEAIKEKTLTYDNKTRDRDSSRLNNTPGRSRMPGLKTNDYETRNKRSVWSVSSMPFSGAHFAVFPKQLIEPCVLAGSRVGDVVIDPFFGSGTTGEVAQKLGRKWLGIELNEDYATLQDDRTCQSAIAFK